MIACMPLHAQTSGLNATVGLSSQLVDRGIALTPVTPILQGAVSWASSTTGWALGLSASTETRDPGHAAEAQALGAYYWSLSDDWRLQAGASYYAYPGNNAASSFDRAETSVNWMYRDVMTFGLSAIYLTNGNDHQPRGAADVDFHWPLPWHLSFSAGAGVTQPLLIRGYGGYAYEYRASHLGSYYGYGHAGLIWDEAPWRVELERIATSPNIGRQANGVAAAPWVATISWSF
ncbi:hypothetical protein GCM10011408_25830 [Dyella caseinilytica]|nr:hypothetical protein GCM10011408_25830 [Dyella caseinilytica]